MTRLLDILFSALGLLLLSPLLAVVYVLIRLDSPGGGIYQQERIGKSGRPFRLYKFRTMYVDSDSKGLITVGGHDSRITRVGYFLRRFKIDELPQLVNVLKGDMSLVGPRPEVEKYVRLYTTEQRLVLTVRPGVTDYASVAYAHENELLADAEDPDRVYVEQIMPDKIRLNMRYIEHPTVGEYFKVIFLTLRSVFGMPPQIELKNKK